MLMFMHSFEDENWQDQNEAARKIVIALGYTWDADRRTWVPPGTTRCQHVVPTRQEQPRGLVKCKLCKATVGHRGKLW